MRVDWASARAYMLDCDMIAEGVGSCGMRIPSAPAEVATDQGSTMARLSVPSLIGQQRRRRAGASRWVHPATLLAQKPRSRHIGGWCLRLRWRHWPRGHCCSNMRRPWRPDGCVAERT